MPKGLITAIWLIWLAVIWLLSIVVHAMAFNSGGINWLIKLLGIFWLIYLAGLWFEQTRITDIAWAMLLGYAIGCIRMLVMIPNQQEYANWLKFVPKNIVGIVCNSVHINICGCFTLNG